MFRPNRIGTPIIHSLYSVTSTDIDWQSYLDQYDTANTLNVLNAIPGGDFQRIALKWTASGAQTFAAGKKLGLGQQFTITPPIQGDTVGVELNGALIIKAPPSALIVPFFTKLGTSVSSTLATSTAQDAPTYMQGQGVNPQQGNDNLTMRAITYQRTLIVRHDDVADIPGVYAHGLQVYNQGADFSFAFFRAVCSVRQLNDQQNIGYRDTLR